MAALAAKQDKERYTTRDDSRGADDEDREARDEWNYPLLDFIIVHTDGALELVKDSPRVGHSEALRKAVGGFIEYVPPGNLRFPGLEKAPVAVYANEEGLYLQLERNIKAKANSLVLGNMVIIGLSENGVDIPLSAVRDKLPEELKKVVPDKVNGNVLIRKAVTDATRKTLMNTRPLIKLE